MLGLAGLVTFPVAALLLGWLYLSTHAGPSHVGFSGAVGILLVVGILLAACAVTALVHELIHALAMLVVGHTPRLHMESTPYLRLTLDRREKPYRRGAFVLVNLAPVVLVTAALIVGVVRGPYAGWLIVPAAFHITASKMDIAYSLVALRQRAGTLFRIGENGLELTPPADDEVP